MKIPKNKNDQRFVKAESKIIKAAIHLLSRRRFNFYTRELCKEAHIFNSTFYNHYANAEELINEIEKAATEDCLRAVNKSESISIFVQKLIVFIGKRYDYFKLSLTQAHHICLMTAFRRLKPLLIGHWRPRDPEIMEYWFQMLCYEIIGTITTWGQQSQFNLKSAPVVQRRLEKIINTAEMRFRQLENIR